jgi:hypothetical protein
VRTTLFNLFAPRVKVLLAPSGLNDELVEEVTQEAMLPMWRKAFISTQAGPACRRGPSRSPATTHQPLATRTSAIGQLFVRFE